MAKGKKYEAVGMVVLLAGVVALVAGVSWGWVPVSAGLVLFIVGRFL